MRILVAGASGLIGSALVPHLTAGGHTVERLVRRRPRSADEHNWAPSAHILDAALLEGVDAVIDLAGASLARLPWTTRYRAELVRSRIDATRTLTEAMSMAAKPPAVLLNASAVGYYGDRPGVRLTEEASRGDGFLADLVDQWERAASLAPERTRTVTLRTGLVIARRGAMRPLALLARAGLGGPIGAGGQHWPWISLADEVAAISHLLESDLAGPVNLAGPVPCTSAGVLRMLARELRRPFAPPLGERLVLAGLGEAGRELLLSSQKVVPERLLADGFSFRHERAAEAIAATFGR